MEEQSEKIGEESWALQKRNRKAIRSAWKRQIESNKSERSIREQKSRVSNLKSTRIILFLLSLNNHKLF